MDFGLTETRQELRDLARRILSDRLTPARLKEIDASAEWFDRQTWAELAKANLLGITIPETLGGLGLGFLDQCLLLAEVGRAVAPVPAAASLVSGAMPVARFGTAEQQEVLPQVVSGDAVLTAALVEAGAEPESPVTRAVRDGDRWRLTGVKTAVPAAHIAQTVLVPASTPDGVEVFLVPTGSEGMSGERQESIGREPLSRLVLDGVAVGDDARLGDGSVPGSDILAWTVARTTVALCAVASGVSAEALRITAEYTTNRHQFDRPIGSFQAVGQRLADAFIDNRAIELTMLAAATHLDEDREVPDEVATAKFWAADGGSRVVHAALHVHGGISIDNDYPIHRYFLWMKQIESTLGAATRHLVRLGRILAAEPA